MYNEKRDVSIDCSEIEVSKITKKQKSALSKIRSWKWDF
jgi:hypothetical protein